MVGGGVKIEFFTGAFENLVLLLFCLLQGTRWFGEDGQLKRLSSPLKEKPTRPPVINLEEFDPLLQTEWVKV